MKTTLKNAMRYASAAMLALSMGSLLYSATPAQPPKPAPGDVRPAEDPIDNKSADDVRSKLATLVNDAASHNGFNDMLATIDKADRDRIVAEKYKQFDKLNASVDQFRKDFHDKYNQDFSMKGAMLDGVTILRGADKDHARLLLSAMSAPNADKAAKDLIGEVSLVKEMTIGNPWHVEIPATLSAAQLADGLAGEFTALSADKTNWPADAKAAHVRVAQQILKVVTKPVTITQNR